MSHTFTKLNYHCIFATKARRPDLTAELLKRVCGYIDGIVRDTRGQLAAIGGAADHVHLLVSLPSTVSIADAMRLIKTNSSKWLRETFPECAKFRWQTGYAAFTVSASALAKTRRYIENQEAHHRTRTFDDEYREFLQRHGFENPVEPTGSV